MGHVRSSRRAAPYRPLGAHLKHGKCKATGKHRFADRLSALMRLAAIQSKDSSLRKGGSKIENRVYRCEHCHGWHLTKKKGAGRASRPAAA